MDAIQNARKLIDKEYGLLGIPAVRSPRFLSLIRGTKNLLSMTTGKFGTRKAKSLAISYEVGEMASTDLKLNVRIPAWYCYTESLLKFVGRPLSEKESSAVSLTIINGSTIHEGLHVALSRDIMTKGYFERIHAHENSQLFMFLVNIVEDIRMEGILRSSRHIEFAEYIDAKNEIFFSEENMVEELDKVISETENDPKSVALALLAPYKCTSRRKRILSTFTEVFPEVGTIVSNIDESTKTNEVAEELFKLLNGAKSTKRESGDGKLGTGGEAAESEFNMEKALAKKAEKIMRSLLKGNPTEKIDVEEDENKGPLKDKEMEERDITNIALTIYPWDYEDINLDFGFLRKLKVARQLLPSRSEPKTRGSKLLNTRISHIITDGKLFTNHGDSFSSMQRKHPEFVLLLDMSGSMSEYIGRVAAAVRKIAKEMKSADITFAVYGHTSYYLDGSSHKESDQPVLYHIFSYKTNNRTDRDFDNRFELARKVHLVENYDGYAIRKMAGKFNKKCDHRKLLVLSDGSPAGHDYGGSKGNQHTIESIAWVRKQGIQVIAMSLVEDVISANNFLYGKENNVDASTQDKLESQLQKLILGG